MAVWNNSTKTNNKPQPSTSGRRSWASNLPPFWKVRSCMMGRTESSPSHLKPSANLSDKNTLQGLGSRFPDDTLAEKVYIGDFFEFLLLFRIWIYMIKIKSPDEGPLSLNQPMPEQIEILFPGCEEASGQRLNAFLQAGREFQGCSCLGRKEIHSQVESLHPHKFP